MLTVFAAKYFGWLDTILLTESMKGLIVLAAWIAPAIILLFCTYRFLRNPDNYTVQERMYLVAGWCALAFIVR